MKSVRSFVMASTVAPPPFFLCEDLRRHVYNMRRVPREGYALVVTRRRVSVCFLRSERLCFMCYHRARWPRP